MASQSLQSPSPFPSAAISPASLVLAPSALHSSSTIQTSSGSSPHIKSMPKWQSSSSPSNSPFQNAPRASALRISRTTVSFGGWKRVSHQLTCHACTPSAICHNRLINSSCPSSRSLTKYSTMFPFQASAPASSGISISHSYGMIFRPH